MKKYYIIIVFIFLILAYNSYIYYSSCSFAIKINWKFVIPREDYTLYHKITNSSVFGDGQEYTVLKYTSKKKINDLKKINWEKNIDYDKIKEIVNKMHIDKNFIFDENKNTYYVYHIQKVPPNAPDFAKELAVSHIYILYDPIENLLYIIEDIV